MKEIPVGTIGVRINLRAQKYNAAGELETIPIPNATNFFVYLLSPDGYLSVRVGDLTTDGNDGLFGYTLQAGDIVVPGEWKVQGSYENPAGVGPFPTSISKFKATINLYPLNNVMVGPAVAVACAPWLNAVPYPVQGAGYFWWPFGFDGVSAGDTRDSYPTDGNGGVNFRPVLAPILGSHMRQHSEVRLEGFIITAASAGGNLIVKKADGTLIRDVPCPVPLDQPAEIRLGWPIDGPGGFTVASDQPTFILTAIAFYSLLTPTNP